MECAVCLEYSDAVISCNNKKCTSCCCINCITTYLDISQRDNRLPKCINPNCKWLYMFDDFQAYPRLALTYAKCCVSHVLAESGLVAQTTYAMDRKIEEIRQERMLFIQSRFPAAIIYTAKHFMPKKFSAIQKSDIQKLKADLETRKTCFRNTCTGKLSDTYVCDICNAHFCRDCERLLEPEHNCRQEDIETIKVIASMVHCPHCQVAIEKSLGCDSMTCTACHKHFNYSTLGHSNYGNSHNTNHSVRETIVVSTEYRDKLIAMNLLDKVLAIEQLQPNIVSDKPLIAAINERHKSGATDLLDRKIASLYQKIYINRLQLRDYHYFMEQIEKHIIDSTLSEAECDTYHL